MSDVGIRSLEQNASTVVARAAAGEMITITDQGRPVAQITAIPASPLDRLLAAGRVRPARRELNDLPAPAPDLDLSGQLVAMRDDDRS